MGLSFRKLRDVYFLEAFSASKKVHFAQFSEYEEQKCVFRNTLRAIFRNETEKSLLLPYTSRNFRNGRVAGGGLACGQNVQLLAVEAFDKKYHSLGKKIASFGEGGQQVKALSRQNSFTFFRLDFRLYKAQAKRMRFPESR